SAHPGAKKALAEIWNAEDRRHALDAVAAFTAAYGAKFGKAVAKVTDDLDELLAFYDYPAEHWIHLRTTNPMVILSPEDDHWLDLRGCVEDVVLGAAAQCFRSTVSTGRSLSNGDGLEAVLLPVRPVLVGRRRGFVRELARAGGGVA